jgi:hypothetical protein
MHATRPAAESRTVGGTVDSNMVLVYSRVVPRSASDFSMRYRAASAESA